MEAEESAPATVGAGAGAGAGAGPAHCFSKEKLLLELSGLMKGHCYLLHLNDNDQLAVIFPSRLDRDNSVPAENSTLHVPSGCDSQRGQQRV